MTDARRNPYVILGVPFGATAKEARSGFAKASRRLKEETGARYSMEDLTWALHQVEQIIESPAKAFDVYRVPADPTATEIPRDGLFNPEPKPIRRVTEPSTKEQRRELQLRAIRELLRTALTAEPIHLPIPIPYEHTEVPSD